MLVDFSREEIKWIRAITNPRVAVDPTGQYGCPSHGIDFKLRSALEQQAPAHLVELTFDADSPRVRLLHGDGECAEGVSHEGECVLADWVENCEYELLHGSLVAPVEVEWLNDDSPKLTISGPAAFREPTQ